MIRRLIEEAPRRLRPGGALVLETAGDLQARRASTLMRAARPDRRRDAPRPDRDRTVRGGDVPRDFIARPSDGSADAGSLSLIEGGVPLRGEVAASAAKNAALPALSRRAADRAPLTLTNVPDLGDVARC